MHTHSSVVTGNPAVIMTIFNIIGILGRIVLFINFHHCHYHSNLIPFLEIFFITSVTRNTTLNYTDVFRSHPRFRTLAHLLNISVTIGITARFWITWIVIRVALTFGAITWRPVDAATGGIRVRGFTAVGRRISRITVFVTAVYLSWILLFSILVFKNFVSFVVLLN